MPFEEFPGQRLRERVAGLILGPDLVNRDFLVRYVLPEEVVLRPQVLGTWPILVHGCHLQGPAVVFEHLAMNLRRTGVELDLVLGHFFSIDIIGMNAAPRLAECNVL